MDNLILEKYKVQRSIGYATQGSLLQAVNVHTKQVVVIKKSNLKNERYAQVSNESHIQEVGSPLVEKRIYESLHLTGGSPYIMKLYETNTIKNHLYLVMEHSQRGNLFDFYSSMEVELSEKLGQHIFRQVVSGVSALHDLGYAHRGISFDNIVVDKIKTCKLIDMSLACPISKGQMYQDRVGKPLFVAPEVYAGDLYDAAKADVWSLGIVLFMLVTGTPPFNITMENNIRYKLYNLTGIKDLLEHFHATKLSDSLVDLLERMLLKDPDSRITIDEIKMHSWVRGSSFFNMLKIFDWKKPARRINARARHSIDRSAGAAVFSSRLRSMHGKYIVS